MKIIYIFLVGIIILLGAIILNALAPRLGLLTWYEFLKNPSQADTLSYLWLFILYPLGLGMIAYFITRIFNL